MKKFFSLLVLLTCSFQAQAQTSDFAELTPAPYLQKDLTAALGMGLASLPEYADGSKQYLKAFPLVDLQWKSGVFFSTVSGFGYNFSSNPAWQYGVRLGAITNQEQSSHNKDAGPGNTPTDLAPGMFANYFYDQHITLLSSVEAGGGLNKQHDGFLASVGARYVHPIDAGNRVYGILGTTWASLHYMQDYYGVTPAQSASYNFPVYNGQAGLQKVKLTLGWDHAINLRWSVITGVALTQPLGDAKNSPLVSGKIQHAIYSAAYYRF